MNIEFVDRGLTPGEHWYYWEVTLTGDAPQYSGNAAVAEGNLAWSSPLWVSFQL